MGLLKKIGMVCLGYIIIGFVFAWLLLSGVITIAWDNLLMTAVYWTLYPAVIFFVMFIASGFQPILAG